MNKYKGKQGDFTLQLNDFIEKAKGAIEASQREIVIEIGNSIITMSPVDTGRFRNNWNFSINSPDPSITDEVDPSGSKASARLVDGAIGFQAGQTAYITNNLPYAVPLEYGHSDQAPEGMVRITIARFIQIVEEAIRKHKV